MIAAVRSAASTIKPKHPPKMLSRHPPTTLSKNMPRSAPRQPVPTTRSGRARRKRPPPGGGEGGPAGYGPGGGPGAEDIGDEDSTDNQGFDPEQGISLNLIEIGKLRLYPHGIVDRG